MDLIYKLFYTVFSMAVVSFSLLPVVLIIRVIFSRAPKRRMVWMWLLFFMRGICPVALSSPMCVSASLNRWYHMFLRQIGLQINGQSTVLTSWLSVFMNTVTVDTSFKVCSFIWLAGMIGIWVYTFGRKISFRISIKKHSVLLFDNVYQTNKINTPVMTGLVFNKIYIPEDMTANEVKYILWHMQIHSEKHDGLIRFFSWLVFSVQWFNPFMWIAYNYFGVDLEYAADDTTVVRISREGKKQYSNIFAVRYAKQYAQDIVNMDREKKSLSVSMFAFSEKYISERASRMLFYKKRRRSARQLLGLVWFLCALWWFGLRPLQILWNEGTWQQTEASVDGKVLESPKTTVASLSDIVITPAPTEAVPEKIKNVHKLNNATGETVLKVVTQEDDTGSEEIEKIVLNPGGESMKFPKVTGYFCDLVWANTTDSSTGRFAVLIYNGTKAQTFVVYDLEEKDIYYQHEDGNTVLSENFMKYNGDELTLDDDGTAVYNLQEKDGDILTIGFAANISNGAVVNGNYVYNVESEITSEFSYNQSSP